MCDAVEDTGIDQDQGADVEQSPGSNLRVPEPVHRKAQPAPGDTVRAEAGKGAAGGAAPAPVDHRDGTAAMRIPAGHPCAEVCPGGLLFFHLGHVCREG